MGEHKFVAIDVDDLRDAANTARWLMADRLRAAADAAFTVEDLYDEMRARDEGIWTIIARRLHPHVEHKVTLAGSGKAVVLDCTCGWGRSLMTDDPWEPGRLAQEHLDSVGSGR